MTLEPIFARPFRLRLPLFDPRRSPWNSQSPHLLSVDESHLYIKTTCEVLHRFFVPHPHCEPWQDLCPFVATTEFAFPIYSMAIDAYGVPLTTDVQIARYLCNPQGLTPGHEPCERFPVAWPNVTEAGVAKQVPVPTADPARQPSLFAPGGPTKPDGDGNVIIVDSYSNREIDFWQATTKVDEKGNSPGGGIPGTAILWAGGISEFDTTGLGMRAADDPFQRSSRASGLPYLGGLIVPEDFDEFGDGMIRHALAIALPQMRKLALTNPDFPDWVSPASNTQDDFKLNEKFGLAAGHRVVLAEKLRFPCGSEFDTQKIIEDQSLPLVIRSFLFALRHYGAFLVDASAGFSVASEDALTANPEYTPEFLITLMGHDAKKKEDETVWQTIIATLDEWLSWKLGNVLTGKNGGLILAHESADGEFIPNFHVAQPFVVT